MSDFEIIYQTDPSTEKIEALEKHISIELSDEMIKAGWIYLEPCKVDEHSSKYLKQKHASAEALCKESFTITLHNEIPKIPMNLEMPILEKQIKEKGMHAKRKIISKKGKKNAKS